MNNPPNQPQYPPPAGPPLNAPNRPNAPNANGAAKRLSPDQARRRARILKRVALAGTTLAFCGLSGLAASHVVGATSADASSAAPTVAPSQHDDGGFFQDGNSDDEDQHNGQSGGFNFGSGGNFQPPSSISGGS